MVLETFKLGQGYQLKAYSPTELHYISNDSEYRISEQQKIENKTKILTLT